MSMQMNRTESDPEHRAFDEGRAMLKGPDLFERFRVSDRGSPLREAKLVPDVELLVVERNGERRAFIVAELAHPHVAQGTLGGEPYLLAFCIICHSAVGMTPVIDGRVHHFSAGGLLDGVVLLVDDESRSYWDQVTGRCLHGPMLGRTLPVFPVAYTTLGSALKRWPDLRVSRNAPTNAFDRVMRFMGRRIRGSRGFFPPGFKRTMGEEDRRLPRLSQGLGLFDEAGARFYPIDRVRAGVVDRWRGRELRVFVGDDGMPHAEWIDGGPPPMHLFTRWYGFSATFPGCEVFG